ncbi:MAG: ATP synthase subunit I [Culicoidibacterales bacterium]
MEQSLLASFKKVVKYSFGLYTLQTILGVLWQPTQWISIFFGGLLGTITSCIATYLLFRCSNQLITLGQEDAVSAQLKSYIFRFALYIVAIGIVIVIKPLFHPLFVIIGFLIPKVALVIEAYAFNQQMRR